MHSPISTTATLEVVKRHSLKRSVVQHLLLRRQTVVAPSRSAPIRYRFQAREGGFPGAGGFAGKTLREVLSRFLKPSLGTFASGLAYIKWVCSSSFNWSTSLFPKHVLLYHELVFLESDGGRVLRWPGLLASLCARACDGSAQALAPGA